MNIRNSITSVLFLFLYTFVTSQNSVEFQHLSTENGLSQNDVNCIYQDHKGFLWFGTHDGLNKYDGYWTCNKKLYK